MELFNELMVKSELQVSSTWIFKNNGLEKQFVFKNFSQALAFIVQVGILSEKSNHHPELFNVYNKISLRLTTHDSGGVTQKDIDLAKSIDEIQL